jgi:hypothetical protein
MNEVDRLHSDLERLFASGQVKDELRAAVHRAVAAFIGRAAVREDGYAPQDGIRAILIEARRRIHASAFEGEGRYLRIDVLTELDKALAEVRAAPSTP